MKKILLILLLLAAWLGQANAGQTITLRVVEWPPLYYKGADGQWTGLSVELGKAVIEAAGFKTEFAEIHWPGGIKRIKSGDIQMMMNLTLTEERSEFLYWLGPEASARMTLIVKEGNQDLPIGNLDDLVKVCMEQNKRFGIQTNVVYGKEFQKRMENDEAFRDCFEAVDKGVLNLKKVLADRILGFFEQEFPLRYRIKTDPAYKDLAIHPFVVTLETAFIGVSRKGVDANTLIRLHKGYEKTLTDGSLDRIKKKWYQKFPAKPSQ